MWCANSPRLVCCAVLQAVRGWRRDTPDALVPLLRRDGEVDLTDVEAAVCPGLDHR